MYNGEDSDDESEVDTVLLKTRALLKNEDDSDDESKVDAVIEQQSKIDGVIKLEDVNRIDFHKI